jgi:hypothetical protein
VQGKELQVAKKRVSRYPNEFRRMAERLADKRWIFSKRVGEQFERRTAASLAG